MRVLCAAALFATAIPSGHFTALGAEPPGASSGESESSGNYVDLISRQVRADAEAATYRKISERLTTTNHTDAAAVSVLKSLAAANEDLRDVAASQLASAYKVLDESLDKFVREQTALESSLLDEWKKVRAEGYRKELELFNVDASKQFAGQLAILMSVDNRWLWLSGLLAVGTLTAIAMHDRRHELRRWLNGGKARSLGLSQFFGVAVALIAVVTVGIFAFGDVIVGALNKASVGENYSVLQKQSDELQSAQVSLAESRSRSDTAQAQFEKALQTAKANLQGASVLSKELVQQWESILRRTHQANAGLQVVGALGKKLQEDVTRLEALQKDIAGKSEDTVRYQNRRKYIGAGLGLSLLGMVAIGSSLFQRGVRRRQEKISNTCPLCLGESTFVSLAPAGRASSGIEMLQCKNVVSEQPYEQCEFTFTTMYRDVTKLCFPTLGIPQAGKTHWLAMVYRELNRGNYPNSVQFERIKSSSSDDFDIVVDELLNRKIGPAATQTGRIPHPLVFNFLDRDRWGVSDILVNIFDYSGEVIRSQTLEDRQRQRALDGDGFFFFLDPTEPSETQSEALAGFREDLRRIKGVKAGGQIRIPVALCVSKVDLMINEPYADPNGGGVVADFYRDLGKVGWRLDAKSIQARSQLVARLRDTIWPGWQIERQIHQLFGGRFMFFPLSPVGLDGVGEADLARRTIAPVGLLDPLMWLLHMNGYPVLS